MDKNQPTPSNLSELSHALLRHQVGSIDLTDVVDAEEMSENERAEYCAAISAVWPRILKDIKKFQYEQLMFAMNESQIWEQVLMARGTFNGFDLLREHWLIAHNEHVAKGLPKPEFDPHSPVGEVGN
jgi:hypothetical protein